MTIILSAQVTACNIKCISTLASIFHTLYRIFVEITSSLAFADVSPIHTSFGLGGEVEVILSVLRKSNNLAVILVLIIRCPVYHENAQAAGVYL
jgi:hypothetical protein